MNELILKNKTRVCSALRQALIAAGLAIGLAAAMAPAGAQAAWNFLQGDKNYTFADGDGKAWVIHAYTMVGSHTFTPPPGIEEVDVLVVGGGGGGGYHNNGAGGGGGAGGLVFEENVSVSGAVSLTVGAGGAGGRDGVGTPAGQGENGTNSVFGSLDAAIGGGGGAVGPVGNAESGNTGGSGGGNSSGTNQPTPAIGTPGQGNSGGIGAPTSALKRRSGGGGGGAGSVGDDAEEATSPDDGKGGDGGEGRNLAPYFGVLIGDDGWFAGGGGGGCSKPGLGGVGGGGDGGSRTDPIQAPAAGMPSTGGGGGGSRGVEETDLGGADGGSGIVVVRYEVQGFYAAGEPDGDDTTVTGDPDNPYETVAAAIAAADLYPGPLPAVVILLTGDFSDQGAVDTSGTTKNVPVFVQQGEVADSFASFDSDTPLWIQEGSTLQVVGDMTVDDETAVAGLLQTAGNLTRTGGDYAQGPDGVVELYGDEDTTLGGFTDGDNLGTLHINKEINTDVPTVTLTDEVRVNQLLLTNGIIVTGTQNLVLINRDGDTEDAGIALSSADREEQQNSQEPGDYANNPEEPGGMSYILGTLTRVIRPSLTAPIHYYPVVDPGDATDGFGFFSIQTTETGPDEDIELAVSTHAGESNKGGGITAIERTWSLLWDNEPAATIEADLEFYFEQGDNPTGFDEYQAAYWLGGMWFSGGATSTSDITPAAVCLTHGVSLHRGRPDAGNSF